MDNERGPVMDGGRRPSPVLTATTSIVVAVAAVGIAAIVVLSMALNTRIEQVRSSSHRMAQAATAERRAIDTQLDELGSGPPSASPTAGDGQPSQMIEYTTAEATTWAQLTEAVKASGLSDLVKPLAAARADFTDAFATGMPPGGPPTTQTITVDDELTTAMQRLRVEAGLLDDQLHQRTQDDLDHLALRSTQLQAMLIVLLVGSLLAGVAAGVLARRRRLARRVLAASDRDSSRRSAFGNRLQRGLEMTRDEDEVFALMAQAITQAAPTVGAEILLADSSRAHFRRLHATGESAPNCGVASPTDCPAASSGRTELFRDGRSLDVCPLLRGRGDSAVCVPLSVAGRTTGVIHVSAATENTPDASGINDLELVARRGSERLAMVRAFETTSIEANTDALTGLANRRAMQRRLRAMDQQAQPYALAFADLDHFKLVNDRHGHDVGDRSLRAFAMVLTESVRPDDLVVRYGGEEFVVVFPGCDLDQAESILNRVRTRLAELPLAGTIPAFTASFGLAASALDQTFDLVISAADEALLAAKVDGRNRVMRETTTDSPEEGSSDSPEEVSSGLHRSAPAVVDDARDLRVRAG